MYLAQPTIDKVVKTVQELAPQENETILLLFAEQDSNDFDALVKALNKINISFMGGLFPGIIYGNKHYKEGCVIKKLPAIIKPDIIDLKDGKVRIPNLMKQIEAHDTKLTVLTLVDGLTASISPYLKSLFNVYGNSVSFIGGGAGSLSLVQQECVFTNKGVFQDAAIFCLLDLSISLGVRHGWQHLHGPIVATKTNGNTIEQLNWQNAFEVYKSVVEADAGVQFNEENFFDIAKGYPFGISKQDNEDIIRDPIAVSKEGHLLCVGEVPENTVLHIMKGESQSLIESAKLAVNDCKDQLTKNIQHTFVVDCISRILFLEEEFDNELNAITDTLGETSQEAQPMGVLSLGEISSYGNGFIEFYNKTLVIGAMH